MRVSAHNASMARLGVLSAPEWREAGARGAPPAWRRPGSRRRSRAAGCGPSEPPWRTCDSQGVILLFCPVARRQAGARELALLWGRGGAATCRAHSPRGGHADRSVVAVVWRLPRVGGAVGGAVVLVRKDEEALRGVPCAAVGERRRAAGLTSMRVPGTGRRTHGRLGVEAASGASACGRRGLTAERPEAAVGGRVARLHFLEHGGEDNHVRDARVFEEVHLSGGPGDRTSTLSVCSAAVCERPSITGHGADHAHDWQRVCGKASLMQGDVRVNHEVGVCSGAELALGNVGACKRCELALRTLDCL